MENLISKHYSEIEIFKYENAYLVKNSRLRFHFQEHYDDNWQCFFKKVISQDMVFFPMMFLWLPYFLFVLKSLTLISVLLSSFNKTFSDLLLFVIRHKVLLVSHSYSTTSKHFLIVY